MEKMKKNKLAIALTATLGLGAFASTAQAINISNEGVGEYAYIPYFSVTKGQSEVIKLINTSNLTVAVKVTFRRGTDSQEVRDFNVIMSPRDVWSGQIVPSATGAKFVTSDTTCTVPDKNQWVNEGKGAYSVEFDTTRFGNNVSLRSENVLTGFNSQLISKIQEGYVTVAVMGVSSISTDAVNTVPYLAKHVNGVPRSCSSIDWGFANAFASVKSQFSQAENVLSVQSSLIDPARASAIEIPVSNLANAFNDGQGAGFGINNISLSSVDSPNASNVSPAASDVFSDRDAKLYSATFDAPARALSTVFQSESIFGAFDTTGTAQSSWVVNFPTKKWLMDLKPAVQPFSDSIVQISQALTDEEEAVTVTSNKTEFSPFVAPVVPRLALPFEVNVITFSKLNPLSSALNTDAAQGYAKGWQQLGFPTAVAVTGTVNGGTSGGATATYTGMPVIGFEYNEDTGIAASTALRYGKNISAK